jgi:hypothetical protein
MSLIVQVVISAAAGTGVAIFATSLDVETAPSTAPIVTDESVIAGFATR